MTNLSRLLLFSVMFFAVSVSGAYGQEASPVAEPHPGWPEPVGDNANFGLLLVDIFEFHSGKGPDAFRWDVSGRSLAHKTEEGSRLRRHLHGGGWLV